VGIALQRKVGVSNVLMNFVKYGIVLPFHLLLEKKIADIASVPFNITS